jgi:hypothetical protein
LTRSSSPTLEMTDLALSAKELLCSLGSSISTSS